jgi:hypothetical protein
MFETKIVTDELGPGINTGAFLERASAVVKTRVPLAVVSTIGDGEFGSGSSCEQTTEAAHINIKSAVDHFIKDFISCSVIAKDKLLILHWLGYC